jgi:hypothetical protein
MNFLTIRVKPTLEVILLRCRLQYRVQKHSLYSQPWKFEWLGIWENVF